MASIGPSPRPFGELTDFASRVLLASGIVVLVVLVLTLLWYATDVLLVIFAGVLLAVLIRAPVDWLAEHTRLSERWSLALVFVVMLVALLGLGMWVAGDVFEQSQQLAVEFPKSVAEAERWIARHPVGQWLLETLPKTRDRDAALMLRVSGFAYTAFHTIFYSTVLLFVTLYLVMHPRLYIQGLLRLIPIPRRPRMAEVIGATGYTLRWWLIGTLVRMTIVGLLTFAGLWFLNVPLALLLAILAFLLNFVPYFGPIFASVPGILIALLQGPEHAGYVALMYFIVQQVDAFILSPISYEWTVYLPPVVTLLSEVLLFAMVGAVGIALATPLVAVVLVWIKMLYVEEVLGDRLPTPDDEMPAEDIPQLPGATDTAS
jgi:predicted PurR-regulated permease PerM